MTVTDQNSLLCRMLELREFTDLEFSCNGEVFKVHKAVVCAQSPVIKAAVLGGFKESHTNTIIMNNFEPSTVQHLVRFLYTGDYELEASVIKGNIESSSTPETTSTASSSEPPKSASDALFQHIRVNSIGDYYKVGKLAALANTKAMRIFQDDDDESWLASLPKAAEEALESTGDEELLDILSSKIADNISVFLEMDQFRNLAMSTFSYRIIQSCAEKFQLLQKAVEESKVQTQLNDSKHSKLRECVKRLNSNTSCGWGCGSYRTSIDLETFLIRCQGCGCER